MTDKNSVISVRMSKNQGKKHCLSFDSTVRQMTEMFPWPKCLWEKNSPTGRRI